MLSIYLRKFLKSLGVFFFSSCVILSIDVSGRVRRKTNFISLDNSSSLLVFIITAEKNTQVHLIYSTHLARLVFTSYIHFLFFLNASKTIENSSFKIQNTIRYRTRVNANWNLSICSSHLLSALSLDALFRRTNPFDVSA